MKLPFAFGLLLFFNIYAQSQSASQMMVFGDTSVTINANSKIKLYIKEGEIWVKDWEHQHSGCLTYDYPADEAALILTSTCNETRKVTFTRTNLVTFSMPPFYADPPLLDVQRPADK
jgi:hypothetical protein